MLILITPANTTVRQRFRVFITRFTSFSENKFVCWFCLDDSKTIFFVTPQFTLVRRCSDQNVADLIVWTSREVRPNKGSNTSNVWSRHWSPTEASIIKYSTFVSHESRFYANSRPRNLHLVIVLRKWGSGARHVNSRHRHDMRVWCRIRLRWISCISRSCYDEDSIIVGFLVSVVRRLAKGAPTKTHAYDLCSGIYTAFNCFQHAGSRTISFVWKPLSNVEAKLSRIWIDTHNPSSIVTDCSNGPSAVSSMPVSINHRITFSSAGRADPGAFTRQIWMAKPITSVNNTDFYRIITLRQPPTSGICLDHFDAIRYDLFFTRKAPKRFFHVIIIILLFLDNGDTKNMILLKWSNVRIFD